MTLVLVWVALQIGSEICALCELSWLNTQIDETQRMRLHKAQRALFSKCLSSKVRRAECCTAVRRRPCLKQGFQLDEARLSVGSTHQTDRTATFFRSSRVLWTWGTADGRAVHNARSQNQTKQSAPHSLIWPSFYGEGEVVNKQSSVHAQKLPEKSNHHGFKETWDGIECVLNPFQDSYTRTRAHTHTHTHARAHTRTHKHFSNTYTHCNTAYCSGPTWRGTQNTTTMELDF